MKEHQLSVNVMGYPVFSESLDKISPTRKMLINTLNQYCYCMAEIDMDYKRALEDSDIMLPDGIGIVAAAKFLNGKNIKKITGLDLHLFLLQQLNNTGGSCFYLGSSDATLFKIKERAAKEYPAVRVGAYAPPFKEEFSKSDNAKMVRVINDFKPDVLFVGMSAPKQEKWVHNHKEQVEVKLVCSIGAAFDFYAGTITRPHPFWINIGMEWFIRLIREPKRMWKRYLYFGPIFIYNVVINKMKQLF
jgi:N-acetylglucosaminyldiphosphoundecaprenol N-acetyl-beta-D-mannosaminyltransferase